MNLLYEDENKILHLCEEVLIHRDVLLIWTLCEKDIPGGKAFRSKEKSDCLLCEETMKSLSIAGPESEVIPGCDLVRMLIRASERQEKPATITVGEVPRGEGRVMKMVGKALLVVGGLYMAIHLLAWAVK